MPRVFDAFIFYNELKMLKFRLTELNEVVDFFIIVESTHTFSGKKKELYFEKNKDAFSEFKDKIIHIIVEDMPNDGNAWNNEHHQRKAIDRGLQLSKLNNDDIIIIADCDEIPNVKTINDAKTKGIGEDIYSIEMEMYYYHLECFNKNCVWSLTKMLKYKKYKQCHCNPQFIRHNGNEKIHSGGWHFSYFGDVSFIKNKIQHFSHQEYNNDKYLNDNLIQEQIDNCSDLFFRDNKHYEKYSLVNNKNLPKHYEMLL